MSSSSESSGKVSATRSSFGHRCNLLSQYLKEKGGFGDLSLGITATAPAPAQAEAMGLFPKQRQVVKSMDLFPRESGFGSSDKEGIPGVVAEGDNRSAQMTIFYGGQVIVFDDFPADKAKEVMLLAGRSSSQFYSTSVSDLTGPTAIRPSETIKASDEPGRGTILPLPRTPEPVACDLPLARRNSLHRFLEKRKDRITARSPYSKICDSKSTSSPISNPVDINNKSWLSLSAQRH